MTSMPSATTISLSNAGTASAAICPLQRLAGLFFAVRIAITFLGFQSNPRLGTLVMLLCGGTVLFVSLITTFGGIQLSALTRISTLRWIAAYLALSAASLLWTQATSPTVAASYWAGMCVDIFIVALLCRSSEQTHALFQGFALGMLVIAVMAWLAPRSSEGRLGNDDFLHPNVLGLYLAIAVFLSQHIAFKHRYYRYVSIALVLSLLRTISKTSIAAFFIAEAVYLLTNLNLTRHFKIRAATFGGVTLLLFLALSQSYLSSYAASPDGSETLSGRTVIWAASWLIAVSTPWLGHGIYSYTTLIPFFGPFQPRHAHNELLQQFFDYGIFGVAVTVGLYASLLRAARRFSTSPYAKLSLTLAIFALIHGLTDTINFDFSLPLWLFTALAIGLNQRQPVVNA